MVVVGWLVGLLIADGEGVQVHCDVIPLCHNCQLFLSRQLKSRKETVKLNEH